MRKQVVLTATFVLMLTACSEKPIKTVEYYKQHKEETKVKLKSKECQEVFSKFLNASSQIKKEKIANTSEFAECEHAQKAQKHFEAYNSNGAFNIKRNKDKK